MTVTFTLTGGSASTDAGPFNISGTTSGGALNGVSIATGITKQQLLTGHTVTNINDTITGGTIASTGTCTTTDTWSVTPSPTPTSTATPTPYTYTLGPSYLQSNIGLACSEIDGVPTTEVYAATNVAANVTQFFTDTNLTIEYTGGVNNFHAYYLGTPSGRSGFTFTGRVSTSGEVSDKTMCL
jgi:hypothetical protein